MEQLRREDWVAEAIEEVAERQLTEGSEKRLLREEVAKRRGPNPLLPENGAALVAQLARASAR